MGCFNSLLRTVFYKTAPTFTRSYTHDSYSQRTHHNPMYTMLCLHIKWIFMFALNQKTLLLQTHFITYTHTHTHTHTHSLCERERERQREEKEERETLSLSVCVCVCVCVFGECDMSKKVNGSGNVCGVCWYV